MKMCWSVNEKSTSWERFNPRFPLFHKTLLRVLAEIEGIIFWFPRKAAPLFAQKRAPYVSRVLSKAQEIVALWRKRSCTALPTKERYKTKGTFKFSIPKVIKEKLKSILQQNSKPTRKRTNIVQRINLLSKITWHHFNSNARSII